ncbi:GNAT family N-acetyltransferase [Streptomyces liangshanensis]|uniref:GNAT family N-acetyltransferase n=1 Tax=Streptomyces liangshanensis TaxID=2717324 RepID=A0A6G9H598_9ACTN|nr:GNAT family N-acetyltransferase [Streptomyces liangshanensis]QIQ05718.1 GNAT family N-acetyltransferase [Streptomyces liangshanensis]
MTTTLRPTEPLRQTDDGARSRTYEVCVNSRPVGTITLGTDPGFGPAVGVIQALRIEAPDRRRGRGTVAALAAEEVLRGWGCEEVLTSVEIPGQPEGTDPTGDAALRLVAALGYTERSSNMVKALPSRPPELPAALTGRPLDDSEYEPWWAAAAERYAQAWIDRGASPELARNKAETARAVTLPEGLATPGVSLSALVHDERVVGTLWVSRREETPEEPGAYVYDVVVAEDQRGKGYGRALMLLAERVALGFGAARLGLHVFAGNTPAIRLYESLGYTTTHRNFRKTLL